MRRFVLYSAFAGFLIPVAFILSDLLLSLSDSKIAMTLVLLRDRLLFVFWPGYMMLMGMRGAPWSEIVPMMAISVVINIAVYSILGVIAWWVWTRV